MDSNQSDDDAVASLANVQGRHRFAEAIGPTAPNVLKLIKKRKHPTHKMISRPGRVRGQPIFCQSESS